MGARPRALSDVVINPKLAPDTFETTDIHAGTWKAGPGRLDGQLIGVFPIESSSMVWAFTNWVRADLDQAGLKNGDRLMLEVEGLEPL